MMNETKKVFKWWWGWNPEKIEKWLEEQELNGWNLEKTDDFGIRFWFRKGQSQKMAYRIDFQPKIREEYRQLFSDAGWQLVKRTNGGWYFWRQPYDEVKPEIFTDPESLIDRNRRLLPLLLPVLFILLADIPILFIFLTQPDERTFLRGFFSGFLSASIVLLFIIAIIVIKIIRASFKISNQRM